jgi:hypothetical protein
MERLLSFQYKIGMKPKLEEFLIPLSEKNGTFAFILAKIEINQSKKNLYDQFWNEMECYFYSSKNLEQNQSKSNYSSEFQREMERFVLFQLTLES